MIMEALRQADEATVAWSRPASDVPLPDLPINHFPGYVIKGEIHRGGQGVVYRASQPSTGRTVAIKLMHPGAAGGSTGRARFELEVQVLGRLDHPGIVRVHDSGVTDDGSVYYVMDYVGGQPLDAMIRQWRRDAERARDPKHQDGQRGGGAADDGADPGDVPSGRSVSRTTVLGSRVLRTRLELFAKICEGVSAAHIAGVIHRDLKPANIRLDRRGDPIVVDFGLAKLLGEQAAPQHTVTTTGQFVGSMPWSSPEQAEGSPRGVDTRTDVYSLGVILYQMVTSGRFPYTVVGTARQVMNAIVNDEPRRPSLHDRGVNDEVETIILKALSKEPERRYQSAGEFARDVRRYLDGEAIEAKRDSTWYVMTKTLRRHRVSAGFVGVLVLMGTAFSAALAAKYTEAESLRVDAESRAEAETLARQRADTERARAQANFRAVQDLSHVFLFGVHDEIEHLRGAGAARALLVETAAEYLERLRVQADAESDPAPSLLLDLAAAHDRLAAVQAGFADANRGETEAAAANLVAAAGIRDLLLERTPGDPDLWLGIAEGAAQEAELDRIEGRFEEGIDACRRGLEAVDRAEDLGAPIEEANAVRVVLHTLWGDLDRRLGRAASDRDVCVAWYRSAIERYELAGDVLADDTGGRLDAAELLMKRAMAMTEIARRAETGVPGAREAVGLFAEAFGAFEGVRDADPSVRAALRGMVVTKTEESLAWETIAADAREAGRDPGGDEGRALAAAEEALSLARRLAADESDLDAQRLLGIAMNKLGNAWRGVGRLDEAEVLNDELIAHRRGLVFTDPTAMHRRDLAVAMFKGAQIDAVRGSGSVPAEASALYASAEAAALESRSIYEGLASDGVPVEREIAQIDRFLGLVRAAASSGE